MLVLDFSFGFNLIVVVVAVTTESSQGRKSAVDLRLAALPDVLIQDRFLRIVVSIKHLMFNFKIEKALTLQKQPRPRAAGLCKL